MNNSERGRKQVRCMCHPKKFLLYFSNLLILTTGLSPAAADDYDIAVQERHSRGMLHDEYINTDCSNTVISFDLPDLAPEDEIFVYHIPDKGEPGVFDFKRDLWQFSDGRVAFNPWYRHNDGTPDCSGSYEVSVTGEYRLYKAFSFPETLPFDNSTRKLIILIHGWNPDEMEDPHSGYGWPSLQSNLENFIENKGGWEILAYNWAADASTGPVLDLGGIDIIGNAIRNGTQAAEISHMHGRHLGSLLLEKLPNIEQVHFIAHSAGTWNARACAIHLSQIRPEIHMQITLLDPYIPGEAPDGDSDCTRDKVDQLAGLDSITLLENYYYANDVNGTQAVFDWRAGDINRRLGSSLIPNPWNHMKPVEWYGGTIEDNATEGWSNSPAFADDSVTGVESGIILPLSLGAAYPNPFNPTTAIPYTVTFECRVKLAVYDMLGRKVRVLSNGIVSPGTHTAVWDGLDTNGCLSASGVYIVKLTAGNYTKKGKVTFMR